MLTTSPTCEACGSSAIIHDHGEAGIEEAANIGGNASDEVKESVATTLYVVVMRRGQGFADSIGEHVRITEVSINQKAEAPGKKEGRVVCETTVTQSQRLYS